MSNAILPLAVPTNEPVRAYAPGSPEKKPLKKRLNEMSSEQIEIPLIIGGKGERPGGAGQAGCPPDHKHVLATFHQAGAPEVEAAAKAAREAWHEWSATSWE